MGFIYAIINSVNGCKYIGSTIQEPKLRFARHLKDLKNGRHHSVYLQRAWNKYGGDSFHFDIIEEIPNDILLEKEQLYLNEMKDQADKCYNVCWTAGNCCGRKLSKKTREKISKSQIGKKISDEAKRKHAETWVSHYGKWYKLYDPNGKVHEFNNIRKFARDNNLEHGTIRQLFSGRVKCHRGWTLNNYKKTFGFISPDGEIYYGIDHLKNFCISHNLPYKSMSALYKGNRKTCGGWRKYNE